MSDSPKKTVFEVVVVARPPGGPEFVTSYLTYSVSKEVAISECRSKISLTVEIVEVLVRPFAR